MTDPGLTVGWALPSSMTGHTTVILAVFLPMLIPPLALVWAVSFGGISLRRRRGSGGNRGDGPISDRALGRGGAGCLVLFFLVFLLFGGGFLYGFFVRPVLGILAAKNWPEVPCTILTSEVKTHRGSDGNTYSVAITYAYEFDGRDYESSRYHFLGGSSSGHARKQAVVDRLPPGTRTVCYVNPADPSQSVLERGLTPDLWFGLIPLVFVLIGAVGSVYGFRQWRRSTALPPAAPGLPPIASLRPSAIVAAPGNQPFPDGTRPLPAEPLELKPGTGPWMKLLGALFVTVFWNGIVSLFVVHAVKGWRSGQGEWFLTLFLIPFVLIGIAMIFAVVYFFLALFNPRPTLRITPGTPRLGDRVQVEWRFAGRSDVLQQVNLWLEGREEATYRRGTNNTTDRNVFARLEIARVSARGTLRTGAGTVNLPSDSMHSFASHNNKIVWNLRIHGDIAFWPDVNEEFPLDVRPTGAPGRTTP